MAIEDDFYFDDSIPTRRDLRRAIVDLMGLRAELALDTSLEDASIDTQLQELADFFGLCLVTATHFVPLHSN